MNTTMKKTMKKTAVIFGATAGLLALLLAPGAALATTVTECHAQIESLKAATAAATFTGQNAAKDEASMLSKLGNAELKLDQAKFADAIQKMTDYKSKVSQLAAAKKMASGEAQDLINGADDIIRCIQSLG